MPFGYSVINYVYWYYDRFKSWDLRKTKQVIQEDYENFNTGPDFLFPDRVGQILANLIIVFSFSTGMPLLYLFGGLIALAQYWSDKYLILRFYRKPYPYDSRITNAISDYLYVLIVMHLLFGMLMFSND